MNPGPLICLGGEGVSEHTLVPEGLKAVGVGGDVVGVSVSVGGVGGDVVGVSVGVGCAVKVGVGSGWGLGRLEMVCVGTGAADGVACGPGVFIGVGRAQDHRSNRAAAPAAGLTRIPLIRGDLVARLARRHGRFGT